MVVSSTMPVDTTADAVWAHLESQSYTVEASGRVASCATCHEEAMATDDLFTDLPAPPAMQ
ncbi:MAG: hypothetical protein WD995_10430 [Gemmatimonadota bacterium]